jgi:putative ABC transport system permease protein
MESLVLANLKHHPARTFASSAGVALGVILVLLTSGFVHGLLRERGRRDTNTGVELMLSQTSQSGLSLTTLSVSMPVALLAQVRNVPGVQAATPVAQHLEFGGSGVLGLRQVDGVDFADYQRTTGIRIIEGQGLPERGDVLIVDPRYAAAHHTKLGDKVRLLERDFTIIGVYAPETGARMMAPLATLQAALGAPNQCSMLLVKCTNRAEQELVAQRLVEQLPDTRVLFTRDLPQLFATGFGALNVFLQVVSGLAALISMLIILLTMYTTVTERTRQIGILKALGASPQFIVWVFLKESLTLSALGVVGGLVIAVTVRFMLVKGWGVALELQAGSALWASLGGMSCGALGALVPSWRAARLDAVFALSSD